MSAVQSEATWDSYQLWRSYNIFHTQTHTRHTVSLTCFVDGKCMYFTVGIYSFYMLDLQGIKMGGVNLREVKLIQKTI